MSRSWLSLSRLGRKAPLAVILMAAWLSGCGSSAPVSTAPSSTAPTTVSSEISEDEAIALYTRRASEEGPVYYDLEGRAIDVTETTSRDAVSITGATVIRAPRNLSGLWLVTVDQSLKFVYVSEAAVQLPSVQFFDLVDISGDQRSNSFIVADAVTAGPEREFITVDDVNTFLEDEVLPQLNSTLPSTITDNGLDPLADVASGSETLGSVNIGVTIAGQFIGCRASAQANYNISNLRGLSSLQVNTLAIDTLDVSNGLVDASGSLSAGLSSVSLDAGGGISGSCRACLGDLGCATASTGNVGISGSVSVPNITASGTLNLDGYYGEPNEGENSDPDPDLTIESCIIDDLFVDPLSITFGTPDISINGLGVFNDLLDPLIGLIDDLVGSSLEGSISDGVKSAINSALVDPETSVLPLCIYR